MTSGGEYETLETHATVNALIFVSSFVLTTVTPLTSFCCASVISGTAGILIASFCSSNETAATGKIIRPMQRAKHAFCHECWQIKHYGH
jgi:hypothetical protein